MTLLNIEGWEYFLLGVLIVWVVAGIVSYFRVKKYTGTSSSYITYEQWKDRFPKAEKKETIEEITIPKKKKYIPKAGEPRRRPRPIPKTIQEQIDDEYHKLNNRYIETLEEDGTVTRRPKPDNDKPGIGGTAFTLKLEEDWSSSSEYLLGVDPYRKEDHTEPQEVVFGGGNFGAAGASDSWEPDTRSDDLHNYSDSSSDTSNNDTDDGYQTTDHSEGD